LNENTEKQGDARSHKNAWSHRAPIKSAVTLRALYASQAK